MKNILVVGATSAIAEHCARLWARTPCRFLLAGRDAAKLAALAGDLRVRSPACEVLTASLDFTDAQAIARFVSSAFDGAPIDVALVAHGMLPDQAACQADVLATAQALVVNALSPALFAEAIAARLQAQGHGTLAVIGSVAGDRGRQSNYVYGAAKGLLDRYLQGLRHRFAGTAVRCVLVKPGPTDTPMTAALRGRGARLAPVERVAADIVAGIERGRPVVYTPARWRWIMLVICLVPEFLFIKTKL